ncbi:MAG: HAMP domain-containing protein, partial [Deltaproteobacteria bacterium]|nr:HAMP domain-containing protein [Deltaproteobacteria bacterium]
VALQRLTRSAEGAHHIAAFAPAPDLGWSVLVQRRESVALAPAEAVRRFTLFWSAVALLVAGAMGLLLARGVTRPVSFLSHAVKEVAAGRYRQSVPVEGRDEIALLGEGFNQMAREIRRRDAEIHAFNAQLELRVQEKTRELQEAQDQIQRTRRLAALGSLSAGIAHELNNPLTGIIGLGKLLEKEIGGSLEARETLGLLLGESRRMARIIGDLRQLAEREIEQAGARFNLHVPLDAALSQASESLSARSIELRSPALTAALPEIQGHSDGLKRVFSELVQNAVSSMPHGGVLTVSVDATSAEAVRVSVRDTGRGIPASVRERIFDPFFTTKDEPGRVGLGLSVCSQIIEAHHGRILVDSEEGRGSTFTVILPAAGAKAHLQ